MSKPRSIIPLISRDPIRARIRNCYLAGDAALVEELDAALVEELIENAGPSRGDQLADL